MLPSNRLWWHLKILILFWFERDDFIWFWFFGMVGFGLVTRVLSLNNFYQFEYGMTVYNSQPAPELKSLECTNWYWCGGWYRSGRKWLTITDDKIDEWKHATHIRTSPECIRAPCIWNNETSIWSRRTNWNIRWWLLMAEFRIRNDAEMLFWNRIGTQHSTQRDMGANTRKQKNVYVQYGARRVRSKIKIVEMINLCA